MVENPIHKLFDWTRTDDLTANGGIVKVTHTPSDASMETTDITLSLLLPHICSDAFGAGDVRTDEIHLVFVLVANFKVLSGLKEKTSRGFERCRFTSVSQATIR